MPWATRRFVPTSPNPWCLENEVPPETVSYGFRATAWEVSFRAQRGIRAPGYGSFAHAQDDIAKLIPRDCITRWYCLAAAAHGSW